MRRFTKQLVLASLVVLPFAVSAQTRLNFVSCPIVRDTSTVPCWLTQHEGELYYMGIQTDVSAEFQPPYLGHLVLVEGVVADVPRICGGIVLEPIRISVMPELDASCNTILPAESQYTIDFNPRPPGPSAGRLAFAAPSPTEPELREPYESRSIHLFFDFDRGISFRHPATLLEIKDYAEKVSARRIAIHATRGTILLSDGTLLTEDAQIARRRSEEVAALLRGVGLEADIQASWSGDLSPADGIDDWMSRGVEVLVEP